MDAIQQDLDFVDEQLLVLHLQLPVVDELLQSSEPLVLELHFRLNDVVVELTALLKYEDVVGEDNTVFEEPVERLESFDKIWIEFLFDEAHLLLCIFDLSKELSVARFDSVSDLVILQVEVIL